MAVSIKSTYVIREMSLTVIIRNRDPYQCIINIIIDFITGYSGIGRAKQIHIICHLCTETPFILGGNIPLLRKPGQLLGIGEHIRVVPASVSFRYRNRPSGTALPNQSVSDSLANDRPVFGGRQLFLRIGIFVIKGRILPFPPGPAALRGI